MLAIVIFLYANRFLFLVLYRSFSMLWFRVVDSAGYPSQWILTFKVFSERELTFTFAICCRPSVCRLSVTFVRPTQAVQIFGNISATLVTLAIR